MAHKTNDSSDHCFGALATIFILFIFVVTVNEQIRNYTVKPLQELIFENGNLVYHEPNFNSIVENAKKELDTLWDEVKRIKNPHRYYVDLSQKLWDLKNHLLENK